MPAPEPGFYRTPPLYRILDHVSGGLLLFAIVWAPWALGTTTGDTITVLTGVGYTLGLLLLVKKVFCARFGFDPVRWVSDGSGWPMKVIAGLCVALLLYVIISVVNKHAIGIYTYNAPNPKQITGVDLTFFESIPWLPASYDWPRSLKAAIRYFGLACFFWATREWIMGKSKAERHGSGSDSEQPFPNERARIALWTLVLSATALALTGILQRFDKTPKLLWLFDHNGRPDFSFGPFAYRGSGAQYLNLIMPVAFGFWWTLREQARKRSGTNQRAGGDAYVMIVPCVILMAAGSAVTTSRGGAAVAVLLLLVAALIVATARRASAGLRVGLLSTVTIATLVSFVLGGEDLQKRLQKLGSDNLGGRGEVYEVTHRMLNDFHVFGSGAETFVSLYAFYRSDERGVWAAYAHNDWMETVITFGWAGASIVFALLLMIPVANLFGRGIRANREFRALIFLSLFGVMVHGYFDFPFQVYGILYTFTFLAAIATLATREA
ncbi:MAG TPA: O-antigen ligase family protein [Candidatus Limnocylindria bacterium]|nr:O-antigen ligase family protein [Candidatus Limnocylindria bacterium]